MSMETNYKVYVHISPNGKRYYGITKQEPKKRWQNGKRYGYNDHFTNAINYYGWDNFDHIIWASGLTQEEAHLGIKYSEEVCQKHRKAVYCVELDKIFDSQKQAAQELGLTQGNISNCLAGRQKQTGGYHFEYVLERQNC